MRKTLTSIRFLSDGIRVKDKWNSLISDLVVEPTNSTGPLSGTTYIVKDNIATNHGYTTAASKILSNYESPFNATIIDLLSSNGSKLIGKSNLDEFGMGSANYNSYFNKVTNPYDNTKVPGGSSGGSAASVAGKMCSFSIGTDTGGSVRLPASYCNVFGFKPTYGRISRWGVIPYAQTLDTVGIIGENVNIIKRVYDVLNKYDDKDPTCLPEEVRQKIPTTKKETLTIGVPHEFVLKELSADVRESWEYALSKTCKLGHLVKPISIKTIKKALPSYYTLATAEAASNLSIYDGIRYGYNTNESVNSPIELIATNRSNGFGSEVQRRILLGNYTLSSDSGDHYLRATQIREELCAEFSSIFNNSHVLLQDEQSLDKVDLIMAPTSTSTAPTWDEFVSANEKNFLNSYVNDVLTVPASLAGIPAISVPVNGIGIQLMGQFGDDDLVLQLADQI